MRAPSGARILDLIEWLAAQARPATLAEARVALDLPKSSTLVLLRILVEAGYAGRADDGRYRLLRLPGEAASEHGAWSTIVRMTEPVLHEAVAVTRESGFIAVMTAERRIRYLCKHMPEREIRYDRDISVDRDAHHVASGIAILAAMSDVDVDDYIAERTAAGALGSSEQRALRKAIAAARRAGIAINLKGRIEGAGGIAAAILDRAGRPIAALNVSGPSERVEAHLDRIATTVRESARLATEKLARRTALAGAPATGRRAGRIRNSTASPQDIPR